MFLGLLRRGGGVRGGFNGSEVGFCVLGSICRFRRLIKLMRGLSWGLV